MPKKIFKCFSIITVFALSFFAFNYFVDAEEVTATTKVTANYTLTLETDYIYPRKAIFGEKIQTIDYETYYKEYIKWGWNAEGDNYCSKPCSKGECNEDNKLTKDKCNKEFINKKQYQYQVVDKSSSKYFTERATINYKITQTLESYVLAGDSCKSNGRGCVAINTKIDNPDIIGVYSSMDENSLNIVRDSICKNKASKPHEGILIENIHTGWSMRDMHFSFDNYSDCKYSSIYYLTYLKEAKKRDEMLNETYVYNSAKALDDFKKYREEVKKGDYVCVATPSRLTPDGDEPLIGDSTNNYIVMEVDATDPKTAANKCSAIFNTDALDVSDDLFADLNINDDGLHLWTFAIYKVESASVSTETMNFSNHSNGITCSWNYKPKDSNTETIKFSFGADLKSGGMSFSDIVHIERLSTSIYLKPADMKRFLEKDASILDEFKQNITYSDDEGVNWQAVGAVALTVLAVAANIAAAVLTGGVSVVLTVAASLSGISAFVSWSIVAIEGIATYVGKELGEYPIPDVYVGFPNTSTNGKKVEGVSCTYGEYVDNFNIDSNYDVTCENILDGDFGRILNYIMNILRFVACGILILFGVIDFVKPIVSGDAEMLTKSGKTFIKRIIVFVLILFAPVLVNFLLSLIGETSCNI